MPDHRKKLVAPLKAVKRIHSLAEAGAATVPRQQVGRTSGGDEYATAKAAPRRASRPVETPPPPPEIGLAATGELEPTIRQSIADTVSKLFGGAIKVRMGRVNKAVAEAERKAAQDTSTSGPTKRRAEIAAGVHGVRPPAATNPNGPHKIRGTIDVYGVHFTKHEKDIFARFVKDAEMATSVNITSKIYENMPRGGSSGLRATHITDAQRLSYTRFYFVWNRLGPQFQTICASTVLEVRSESMGRPFTLEEIGSQATNYNDRALCRAAALGFTKATLWRLAELYLEWNSLDEAAREVMQKASDELARQRQDRIGRVRNEETSATEKRDGKAGSGSQPDLQRRAAQKAAGTY